MVALKEYELKIISELVTVLTGSDTKAYNDKVKVLTNEYGSEAFRKWQKIAFKLIKDNDWKKI